jgi:hypothetical protein
VTWLGALGVSVGVWLLFAVVWFHPALGFLLTMAAATVWAIGMFAPQQEVRVRAEDD